MSDNLSDELIASRLKSVNRLNYIYDAGFTLGGPIKRDRLWFYGSFREWGNKRQAANKFYNDAAHAGLHTGPHAPGVREGVVRVESPSPDVAGHREAQDQRLRGSAARLPLPGAHRERIGERARGVLQLQAQAGGAVSGDLELADDEQAAARRAPGAPMAAGRSTASLK